MISAELEPHAEIPPQMKMIRCQFLTLQHQPCPSPLPGSSVATPHLQHEVSASLPPGGLEIKGVLSSSPHGSE